MPVTRDNLQWKCTWFRSSKKEQKCVTVIYRLPSTGHAADSCISSINISIYIVYDGNGPDFVVTIIMKGSMITSMIRPPASSDKVYQLRAHGRWLSPGTQASSTTKAGRPDIAAILLKVALNNTNQIHHQQQSMIVCTSFPPTYPFV